MSVKDQLRAAAPDLASFVDAMRRELGPVKISYLKVGDQEYGMPTDWSKCVVPSDTVPVKQIQDAWYAGMKAAIATHIRMAGKKRRAK